MLSRLTPALRYSLALSTVVPLSLDESPAVRSGVLEALGEVLYSFYRDERGPPNELISLFLGRQEDQPVPRTMAFGLPVPLPFGMAHQFYSSSQTSDGLTKLRLN